MRFFLSGPIPWLGPGFVLSVVVGVVAARRLAAALGTSRGLAFLLVVSVGLILSATLTPLREALDYGAVGSGVCELSRLTPLPVGQWFRLSDPTLNIVLFVPLGIAIGLLPGSRAKAGLLAGAIVLPIGIETIQLLAPALARGCDSGDVVDNLTGLAIGLAVGYLVGQVMRGR